MTTRALVEIHRHVETYCDYQPCVFWPADADAKEQTACFFPARMDRREACRPLDEFARANGLRLEPAEESDGPVPGRAE